MIYTGKVFPFRNISRCLHFWKRLTCYSLSIEYFWNSIWIYCLFACFQQLANYISENSKVKVKNVWNIFVFFHYAVLLLYKIILFSGCGWVWVGMTFFWLSVGVCGWVWPFFGCVWVCVSECDLYLAGCGWVWVGVTFLWLRVGGCGWVSTFLAGYGCVWVSVTFFWLSVGECGWVAVGVGESTVYNYPK